MKAPRMPGIHGTLLRLGEGRLETPYGGFVLHHLWSLPAREPLLVLARGRSEGPEPVLARVHSSCVTSETYGGCDCDCAQQLDAALAGVAREGRGLVFYLMQEGRGAGFAAKARDRMLVQASRQRLTTFEAYAQMGLSGDHRRYEEVAHACALLGVTASLRLLTNNPEKAATLERHGVKLAGTEPLAPTASPFNLHYLESKSRSGHALDAAPGDVRAAELPEAVEAFEPRPLRDAERFVALARYLLPVDAGLAAPVWLRLHAYLDRGSGREHVVFTHGDPGRATPLLRLQRELLLERFPSAGHAGERARWRESVRRFAARGAGAALFLPREDPGSEEPPGDDGLLGLLVRHAGAGEVDLLQSSAAPAPAERALGRLVRARGLRARVACLASPGAA